MKALLDTNIIIHRESNVILNEGIGKLFNWFTKLNIRACIHPFTIEEISKFKNADVVSLMNVKMESYDRIRTVAPLDEKVIAVSQEVDATDNDKIDTSLVNEVYVGRVDYLITEDRKMHKKAFKLGIRNKVFTIDQFLEKAQAENPDFRDYGVLSVRKVYFGDIDLSCAFFDSFKQDYAEFERWFTKKSDEIAYVCQANTSEVLAFLYLKREDESEHYSDIKPPLLPCKRLKIGTFKVATNGFKLGERFIKIIFDNALLFGVDEIYVTIFEESVDQIRLINLLEDWGFQKHGVKTSRNGVEQVLTRRLINSQHRKSPKRFFPFVNANARKYICPIYPDYHTELVPDSILNNESRFDYIDNKPNRNALAKVYISRSMTRDMARGDIIVFYRTAAPGRSAHHTSVATTIAVVEGLETNFSDFDSFKMACRKRSIFNDKQLKEHWDYRPSSRPFVVHFLYVYSLPKRPNLAKLKEHGVISEAPRGFELMSDDSFETLLRISNADKNLIIH